MKRRLGLTLALVLATSALASEAPHTPQPQGATDATALIARHVARGTLYAVIGGGSLIGLRALSARSPAAGIQAGYAVAGAGLTLALAKAHVTVAAAAAAMVASGDRAGAETMAREALNGLALADLIAGGPGAGLMINAPDTTPDQAQMANTVQTVTAAPSAIARKAVAVARAAPGPERAAALLDLTAEVARLAALTGIPDPQVDRPQPRPPESRRDRLIEPQRSSAPQPPRSSGHGGPGAMGAGHAPSIDGVHSFMRPDGTIVITAPRLPGPGWEVVTPGAGPGFGGGAWDGLEEVRRLMHRQMY